ncbi:MAG TPA: hypothetical protein VEQ61_05040 [Thermoleophilaceae bacterium]|nr:hypothetical protein [Thermoleophilaceae bacterium]
MGALCSAGVAGAQTLAQDSVVGSAHDCESPVGCPADPFATQFTQLIADAHSGPGGQDPSGTMEWRRRIIGDYIVSQTRVTCLAVSGRVAVIGVEGTRTFTRINFSLPIAGLIRVTDGGPADSSQDSFEFAVAQAPFPPQLPQPLPGPTDCSSFPAGEPSLHNDLGDLAVTSALPSAKRDCSLGGWRNYPEFRNRGECVAHVVRKARQACTFERVAHGRAAFRAKYGQGSDKRLAMRSCIRLRVHA